MLCVMQYVFDSLCYVLSFSACDSSIFFFFLMIRRPPRSTQSRSSAASDVYKRQLLYFLLYNQDDSFFLYKEPHFWELYFLVLGYILSLSLIHISEPTRLLSISYAVFCLKKKKNKKTNKLSKKQ